MDFLKKIGYWGWVVRRAGTFSFVWMLKEGKINISSHLLQRNNPKKDYLDNAYCWNTKKQNILGAGTIFRPSNSIQMIEKVFCTIGPVNFQSSFICVLKFPSKRFCMHWICLIVFNGCTHLNSGILQSLLNAKETGSGNGRSI